MKSVALILFLLGQCAAGQCPPPVARCWVNYDGLKFQVEGHSTPTGTILWDKSHPFNRRSYEAARAEAARPKIINYGVSFDRMMKDDIPKSDEAKRFIEKAASRSEAGSPAKIHLTVVGSDQDRATVMKDLESHPAFAGLKDHLMIQGYSPDNWAVDPALGFQVQGKPSIIAQLPKCELDPKGGKVIYRADDYSMGPQALATALTEGVRKVDPSYSPAKDPGPASGGGGAPLPFGITQESLEMALVISTAISILFLLPRKEG